MDRRRTHSTILFILSLLCRRTLSEDNSAMLFDHLNEQWNDNNNSFLCPLGDRDS